MILENIQDPAAIRKLKQKELDLLATEVRKRIVEVSSRNGGHLAPSLGAVEIAISLLHSFDPLKDRIVWDVGHQSYAWKILTGRNERFDTLRSLGGISGFTNRDESPYDAFSTGHSSTSVSAALGIACAKEHLHENHHSIAVIGDGALTGGMSFEALNHAGHLQKDKFLVILNDNSMSISKNVGGLQKYMARMLASKPYNAIKKQVWELSENLPENVRRRFILGAQKIEESMINILVPNIIFEDLGFKYVGPIDGHDIKQLCNMFRRIKRYMVGPVLLHVVTQKAGATARRSRTPPGSTGWGLLRARPDRRFAAAAKAGAECLATASAGSPERTGRWWQSPPPWRMERDSPPSRKSFPSVFTMWASPNSTRSPSRRAWPPRGSSPLWRFTAPFSSARWIRSSTTWRCPGCLWCCASTGRDWWARTAPPTTAPSTSPT